MLTYVNLKSVMSTSNNLGLSILRQWFKLNRLLDQLFRDKWYQKRHRIGYDGRFNEETTTVDGVITSWHGTNLPLAKPHMGYYY